MLSIGDLMSEVWPNPAMHRREIAKQFHVEMRGTHWLVNSQDVTLTTTLTYDPSIHLAYLCLKITVKNVTKMYKSILIKNI